ncbi:MAG: hypothetical protein R3D02_14575 [Hyphomicrobiales bacterium]
MAEFIGTIMGIEGASTGTGTAATTRSASASPGVCTAESGKAFDGALQSARDTATPGQSAARPATPTGAAPQTSDSRQAVATFGAPFAGSVVPQVLNGNVAAGMAGSIVSLRTIATAGAAATLKGDTPQADRPAGADAGKADPAGGFGLGKGVVSAMLSTDHPTTVMVKVFTPNKNVTPTIARDRTFHIGPVDVRGKIHGWLSSSAELSVSRPSVSSDGSSLRSATLTLRAGAQAEAATDIEVKAFTFRGFLTGNLSGQAQYGLVTGEERLGAVLRGEVPVPNPYKPETMQPGDTVMIDVGRFNGLEIEGRALGGKLMARAGADLKKDEGSTVTQRIVVRMAENKETGARRLVVFGGYGQSASDVISGGGIWNPSLTKGSFAKDGLDIGGAFLRLVGRATEKIEHNRFDFVEIDPSDTSKGGGRDVYESILATGAIPIAPVNQRIPGVDAHGSLNYYAESHGKTIQLTQYLERDLASPSLFGRKSQLAMQQDYEMTSKFEALRDFDIRFASKESVIRQEAPDHSAEGVEHIISGFGGQSGQYVHRINGLNSTRYSRTTELSSDGSYRSQSQYLSGHNVLERTIRTTLTQNLARAEQGKTIPYESLVVHTKSGDLEGRAALEYLETHDDPKLSWYQPDRVNIRIKANSESDWQRFFKELGEDAREYAKWVDPSFTAMMAGSPQEIQYAYMAPAIEYALHLGGRTVNINNYFKLLEHSEAAGNAQGIALSGEDLGQVLTQLDNLVTVGNRTRPYPIQVHVDVPY